jgi:hypothetical protein
MKYLISVDGRSIYSTITNKVVITFPKGKELYARAFCEWLNK